MVVLAWTCAHYGTFAEKICKIYIWQWSKRTELTRFGPVGGVLGLYTTEGGLQKPQETIKSFVEVCEDL